MFLLAGQICLNQLRFKCLGLEILAIAGSRFAEALASVKLRALLAVVCYESQ